MAVLVLTTFVSLVLAMSGVGLFVWSARARTFDQADRLALLPLGDGREAASSHLGADRRHAHDPEGETEP